VGFWDWLKGKPKGVEVVELVWMNQEAKFQGLVTEIQEQLLATPMILVVAHFPLTLARLRQELDQNNLSYEVQERRLSPADFLRAANLGNAAPILLAQAEALIPDEFPNPVVGELAPLAILVAERHFLRSRDDMIVNFALSLGRRSRMNIHVCLQDPLMQAFAGEWVRGVLSGLGMKDSDAIKSAMVARRIKGAQASFAKRAIADQKANSAEEWLKLNVPDMT
jgi:hypothetical protein